MYRNHGRRWFSGRLARRKAALTIFVTRKLPNVPATFSVNTPVERLARRILPSFNSRSKLIAARRWQTMFRTLRSRRNTDSLLSTGSVAFLGKKRNCVCQN